MKVAVYGTLRKGQSNSARLINAKYKGTFESNPEFTMKSIGDSFPGIKVGGNTSVVFEVYDVTKEERESLDQLEGWIGHNIPSNHYNRKIIHTPWGRALTYTYNHDFKSKNTSILSGDWVEYKQQLKIKQYA